MNKYTLAFIALLLIAINYSCKPKNLYVDACATNGILNVGSGLIAMPTAISPNADGANDVLSIFCDTNILMISNCTIKNYQGLIVKTEDTVLYNQNYASFWDGKNGPLNSEGMHTVSFLVTEKNLQTSMHSMPVCVYSCNSSSNGSPSNKANCRLPDMFNPVAGQFGFATNDVCFK
jgi:hypothetical protein